MFDRLIHTAGFPWTIRAIGFVSLTCALLSFPALLSGTSMLAGPRKRRALFDKSAVKDKLFLLFTLCTFCNFLGYIVPYFYIPTFAQQQLGSSQSVSLYMLIGALAGSFFGRIGSGVLAHYLGAIVTWTLCALTSGILALSWISIETQASFIAFSVFWGTSPIPYLHPPFTNLLKASSPPHSSPSPPPPSQTSARTCRASEPASACRGAYPVSLR